MNQALLEFSNLKVGTAAVDLNTAAITGERVEMKSYERLAVIVILGTSLTGANVQATLRQHNAASAGTSKDLSTVNPYYYKATAAGAFTKVSPASDTPQALYNLSTVFDTAAGIIVFDIANEDLDGENGFDWVSLDLADGAVAKLVTVVHLAHDAAFKPAFELAL